MRHIAALLAIFLVGCGFEGITGSGKLVTKEIPASDFQKIEAGGAFSVDVTQGDKTSVIVTADDNIWEHLNIESRDGTLYLQTKAGSYSNVHLEAKVVTPKLAGIELSGASKGTLHNVDQKSEAFSLSLSGASHAEGDIKAGELKVEESGASHASLKGSADVVHVNVSGASRASLENMTVNVAHASASGASNIDVNASKNLDYELSGASHLTYAGSPKIDKAETSGASGASAAK